MLVGQCRYSCVFTGFSSFTQPSAADGLLVVFHPSFYSAPSVCSMAAWSSFISRFPRLWVAIVLETIPAVKGRAAGNSLDGSPARRRATWEHRHPFTHTITSTGDLELEEARVAGENSCRRGEGCKLNTERWDAWSSRSTKQLTCMTVYKIRVIQRVLIHNMCVCYTINLLTTLFKCNLKVFVSLNPLDSMDGCSFLHLVHITSSMSDQETLTPPYLGWSLAPCEHSLQMTVCSFVSRPSIYSQQTLRSERSVFSWRASWRRRHRGNAATRCWRVCCRPSSSEWVWHHRPTKRQPTEHQSVNQTIEQRDKHITY